MSQKKSYNNLLSLIPFFKPYKFDVVVALLALAVTALMILFFGKAIKYLIDFGFVQQNAFFLNLSLLIFVAAVLVMAVAGYYRASLTNSVAERVIADLRKKSYDHVIRVSAEFFETSKAGDVISRLTLDTFVLYDIISNGAPFFLRNFLLFVGGIGFLFFTSIKLTLISVMIIPIAIAPIFVMGKWIKRLSTKSQSALALVGGHIEETINGVKTIQSYSCEEKEIKNFTNFVDTSLQVALAKIKIRSLLIATVISLAFGGIAVVLWFGGHYVLQNKMTSGELSSFVFYSVIVASSLASLSQVAGQMQSASAASGRIFELLKIDSPVKEVANPLRFTPEKQIKIECKDVHFSYPSRKEMITLRNINCVIKPAEKIAIVGSSGSGKSTILQLLLRFYDVDSGAILINDIDIRLFSFIDLRQNFSYISQDSFIFSGTIFENIAYVDKSITRADVERIIEEHPFLHFIKKLPDGMDSFAGSKGIKLSGGERQRIAIARAIIKDSPVLLLDEATSALDSKNEQSIMKIIDDLARHKTVISIAHKLSSVINSDRIIFIKDGEIAEIGSHRELMEWNGFYKKMYEMEVVGGAEEEAVIVLQESGGFV